MKKSRNAAKNLRKTAWNTYFDVILFTHNVCILFYFDLDEY